MDAALDGLGVYSLKCVLVNVEIPPVLFGTTHSQKRETTWCYRKPNAYLLLSQCKASNLILNLNKTTSQKVNSAT